MLDRPRPCVLGVSRVYVGSPLRYFHYYRHLVECQPCLAMPDDLSSTTQGCRHEGRVCLLVRELGFGRITSEVIGCTVRCALRMLHHTKDLKCVALG